MEQTSLKLRKCSLSNYEILGAHFKQYPKVQVVALFLTDEGFVAVPNGAQEKQLPSIEMGQHQAFPDVVDWLTSHVFDSSMGFASACSGQLPQIHGTYGDEGQTLFILLSFRVKQAILARPGCTEIEIIKFSGFDSPVLNRFLACSFRQEVKSTAPVLAAA